MQHDLSLQQAIATAARPLSGATTDYDPLMRLVGDARFVLIGDASHGTQEFYQERAKITKRLILEKGFNAIAVEADWTAAYHINRYLHGVSGDETSWDALMYFDHFPGWMWRNTDMQDFVRWLRAFNQTQPITAAKVGLYGLDMYRLFDSLAAANVYIDPDDPAAMVQMLLGEAHALRLEREQEAWLDKLCAQRDRFASTTTLGYDGRLAEDEAFYAQQSILAAQSAREYYRSLLTGFVHSWNARDKHMAAMVQSLIHHLNRHANGSRIVVWEHNTHVGDARATDMRQHGEWSLGQLMRERYGRDVVLIGLTAYTGEVTCAESWNGPPEQKPLPPALPGSYEAIFHDTGIPQFYLPLTGRESQLAELHTPHLERAIGLVFHPQSAPEQGYYSACLADQFDALIHFDETHATAPLPLFASQRAGLLA